MAQADSRKAKKPYKQRQRKAEGRKSRDGSESVIKLETLRTRAQNLIELRLAMGDASARYNNAVKAVAEATGLLSTTVNKYVRARAGDNFREDRMKAQQLALVFEECGELDGTEGDTGEDEQDEGDLPPHVTDPDNHADPAEPIH